MVLAVELADLAFSLDNVVAVVALSDNLYIVMFGVAIGIITMRFAASLFTLMITREPILKPAAYIVVFNIGAELLIDEWFGIEFSSPLKFMISAGTLIVAVIYAHVKPLHTLEPIFIWLGQGMANVNELLDWLLKPVFLLIKGLFRVLAFILRPIVSFLNIKPKPVAQQGSATSQIDCEEDQEKKQRAPHSSG